MDRENFPLDVGDKTEIDGQEAKLIDVPTDGPLFELPNEEPPFDQFQMGFDEAEEKF